MLDLKDKIRGEGDRVQELRYRILELKDIKVKL